MSECTVDNSFALKLYNWRMANNLTQREAAVSLGCQQAQIGKRETGKNLPYAKTMARILPIIEGSATPAQEPEEELWVPEPVEPKRPLTFRERMEQMHGGPEDYFARTRDTAAPAEEESEVEVVDKMPLEVPAKPTATALKMAKVIGFMECLALYAAEGVAEPLEEQIKVLKDIAEEMGA